MCDSGKTKVTLIEELQTLRSRAAKLERIEAEHKKVEQKLKQYQFMVESAHDVIFFKDLKSRYVIANDETLEAFGLPREQVIGKNDYEIMPEKEEAGKNIEDDKLVFETGKPTEITKHMTGSDGKERWFQAIKVPQFDNKGNIVGLIGIARDITALKRAEEALRESQRWQRAILDSIPDIAWLKDKEGRYVAANEPLCKAFGMKLEDLIGKTDFDISPEDLAKRYRADDQEVMKSGKRKRIEEPWEDKDGKRIWIETIKTPIYNDKGEVIGTSGIARDITERKKAEEELKAFEERFSGLAERSFDLIFMTDSQGYLTYISAASEKIFHYKPEEMIGTHFKNYLIESEIPRVSQRFAENMQGRNLGILPMEAMRKDGSHVFVELNSSPILKEGETIGIQGIIRDITERKKAEEALRGSEEKYRLLFEGRGTDNTVISVDGVYLMMNEKGAERLGGKPEHFVGKSVYDTFPKDAADEYVRRFRHIAESGETKTYEDLVELPAGNRWFLTNARPVKEPDGKRKKVEEALRESENKYRTLLENLPQKIFLKDRKSVYVSCNDNLARDFKIKSEEIAGKTDYDLVPKELAEKYRADDKRIIESGETEAIEEKYVQEGEERIIHTVKTPVKDAQGNVIGILGIFWDATEHKKAEEELLFPPIR